MYKVFIDGSAGTTGLRISKKLAARRDITVVSLPEEVRKNKDAQAEAINSSDVVFLCLPDDAAREAVSLCENDNTIIIDASTAHRTDDAWVYGLPELSCAFRNDIKHGKRIANPGCHATGFCVCVYPLVFGDIIADSYPLTCFSLTGYSGGGKKMIAEYARPDWDTTPAIYSLGGMHKHLPEMMKVCSLSRPPVLEPIVSDYYCGMVVTVPLIADFMKKKMGVDDLYEYFTEYYANSPVIKVRRQTSGLIYSDAFAGRDDLEIIVGGCDDRPQISARFCNLGKGASGAAIQNMNIALGLDETKGLIL